MIKIPKRETGTTNNRNKRYNFFFVSLGNFTTVADNIPGRAQIFLNVPAILESGIRRTPEFNLTLLAG